MWEVLVRGKGARLEGKNLSLCLARAYRLCAVGIKAGEAKPKNMKVLLYAGNGSFCSSIFSRYFMH